MKLLLSLISIGVVLSVLLCAWGLYDRMQMKKDIAKMSVELEVLRTHQLTAKGQNRAPAKPQIVKVSIDDNPILGEADAPVTIIEFGDYQCPFCKRNYDQVFRKIESDYINKGKVRYVFRNFPLPFHDKAMPAAIAANCAGKQGKYWEFHDLLYKDQQNLNIATIPDLAKQLGLNEAKLKECIKDGSEKSEIEKDIADARKYGVSGTPTFFIGKTEKGKDFNGERVVGALPYNVFKENIDKQLKEADQKM